MLDRQLSQESALLGSPHTELSALILPADDDAGLLALEVQFNSLIAEMVAVQNASDPRAIYPGGQSLPGSNLQAGYESDIDQENRAKKAEDVLARLYPIEQAIMATPARTINRLGVKAHHAAYVMSHYWEAPIEQIDWDARAIRLLIEAVCLLANVPLPSCETATEVPR
jgi:hypothetical protein